MQAERFQPLGFARGPIEAGIQKPRHNPSPSGRGSEERVGEGMLRFRLDPVKLELLGFLRFGRSLHITNFPPAMPGADRIID